MEDNYDGKGDGNSDGNYDGNGNGEGNNVGVYGEMIMLVTHHL